MAIFNRVNMMEITTQEPSPGFQRLLQTLQHPTFALVWFGCAICFYLFFDRRIAMIMHHLTNPYLLDTAQLLTSLGLGSGYLIVTALLLIVTTFWIKRPRISACSLFLFLSVALPGIVCDIAKIILGRSRPIELFHHHLYGFHFLQFRATMWSFPSGHSTTIMGIMMALSLLFPRFWMGFLTLAVTVALSRVVVTAHFVSDVMIGCYLGALMVIYLYQFLVK